MIADWKLTTIMVREGRWRVRNRLLTLLVVGVALAPGLVSDGRAEEKGDAEAVEKVVRSYLGNQFKLSACEKNLGLCLDGASYSMFWKGEGKVKSTTVGEHVAATKKILKADNKQENETAVDSVNVALYGKTGLAVATADFKGLGGVNCHAVVTLSSRTISDGSWKIASVVAEFLESK